MNAEELLAQLPTPPAQVGEGPEAAVQWARMVHDHFTRTREQLKEARAEVIRLKAVIENAGLDPGGTGPFRVLTGSEAEAKLRPPAEEAEAADDES